MQRIKVIILLVVIFTTNILKAETKEIEVLTINDMHANLENFAQFGGIVDSLRRIYPNMIITSAGDNRTGNPFNDYHENVSLPIIELMNALKFNVSAIGNHEFDGNIYNLKNNYKKATFEYLCANVDIPDSIGLKFNPYKIIDVDGIKIGIISVIQVSQRGYPDCHPKNIKGLRFSNVEQILDKYAQNIRNQCDIEILLSHIGYDDDKIIAQKYPMFDAIMGGHSHTLVPANTIENNVLITQSSKKVRYCTLAKFIVENGKVVNKSSEVINIQSFSTKSEMIENMVKKYCSNPTFNEVITKFDKPIKGAEHLGCMMADGQREICECDFGLQNGGGVRYDSHDAGLFTVADGLKLDPFGNLMWVIEIKGADISKLIQDCYTSDELQKPYVSGLKYDMVVDKKDVSKIKSMSVRCENGKRIKKRHIYKLSVNSYVVSILKLSERYKGIEQAKTSFECLKEFLRSKNSIDYSTIERAQLITK